MKIMKAIIIWVIWFLVSATITATIVENNNFSNGINAIIGLVIFFGLYFLVMYISEKL